MEPDTRSEFDKIWAVLRAMAERENQIELRADKRFAQAERRLDKLEQQTKATRDLVHVGMKLLSRLDRKMEVLTTQVSEVSTTVKDLADTVRELAKSQKAFLDSFKRRNGNGRKRPE